MYFMTMSRKRSRQTLDFKAPDCRFYQQYKPLHKNLPIHNTEIWG